VAEAADLWISLSKRGELTPDRAEVIAQSVDLDDLSAELERRGWVDPNPPPTLDELFGPDPGLD